MSFTSIVAYPAKDGARFDLDYYLTKHMPLAYESFKPFGCVGYTVSKFEKSPHLVHGMLFWKDADASKKAMSSPAAKKVFADVPNYTDLKPVVLSGKVVAKL